MGTRRAVTTSIMVTMRRIALVAALIGALIGIACGDGYSRDQTPSSTADATPCASVSTCATVAPPATTITPGASETPRESPVPKATPTQAPAPTPPSSGDGTIDGLVLLGPTCPVVRPGDPNCDDRPFEADIDVFDAAGAPLGSVHSGADGKFSLALPAGQYHLVGRSPNSLPRGGEVDVTVIAGQTTQVTVHYDSGIR